MAQVESHSHVQLAVEQPEVAGERIEHLRRGAELHADAVIGLCNLDSHRVHEARQVVQTHDPDGMAANGNDARNVRDRESSVLAQHVVGGDSAVGDSVSEAIGEDDLNSNNGYRPGRGLVCLAAARWAAGQLALRPTGNESEDDGPECHKPPPTICPPVHYATP